MKRRLQVVEQGKLAGRRIAALVADGFEAVEYTVPVNALRLSGAEVTVISLRHGRIRGVNLHEPAHRIHADLAIGEARPEDFDGLFFPGGFINPDLLRQSARVREFVRAMDAAGKPIATLCHGPWVLASAGLLKGRAVTSWPGVRDDLVNAGALWLDQPVVRDRNWLTSRGPQDLPAYIPALRALFSRGADLSRPASSDLPAQAVSAPAHDEPPAPMINAMRWMPRPTFRGLALGALLGGLLVASRQRRAA